MTGTYNPTGAQAGKAFEYGSQGRDVLDRDLVKSTNLLDERTTPAHQSESIGVGTAARQAIDAAQVIAKGDAEVGMANTLARNTRANKEYDAFTSLNKASYDNKSTMLSDSIDAANLFNQNDMAALINKGSAYDTQQYGLTNKKVDQGYLMDAKAQDQVNLKESDAWKQQHLLDTKAVTQANLKESDAWTQEDKEDTLALEQKYDYQDRADEWIYDAKDLEKRNEYIQEQDNNNGITASIWWDATTIYSWLCRDSIFWCTRQSN